MSDAHSLTSILTAQSTPSVLPSCGRQVRSEDALDELVHRIEQIISVKMYELWTSDDLHLHVEMKSKRSNQTHIQQVIFGPVTW